MNLPFSSEQFFEVFRAYNTAIWPAQFAAYSLALLALWAVFYRSSAARIVVPVVLACFWLFTGLGYHIAFFSRINPAAFGFGALFIIQALLLLYGGLVRQDLSFRWQPSMAGYLGLIFVSYAALIYPWLGSMTAHAYPRSPLLGVTPCPTTIFTFGMYLFSPVRPPLALLVIPLLWVAIGSVAAFQLGVREDFGMLVAGVLGMLVLLRQRSQTE